MQTYERRKKKKRENQIVDDHITPNSLPKESPRSKPELSTAVVFSPDETNGAISYILALPSAQWSESHNKRKRMSVGTPKTPVSKDVSVSKLVPRQNKRSRNVDEQRNATARKLKFIPDTSRIRASRGLCPTPGTVVWAKNAHLWWPAEISRLGSPSHPLNSSDEGTDGRVLVQFYGNKERAWVDPARDLSAFEDYLEERGCNPTQEFQEALKQAIHMKEQQTSDNQLHVSPERPVRLNVQEQSPDLWNSSSSSRSKSDSSGRAMSKRKIKPRVHFDEVDLPLKSPKKVRRLKIMRLLGLAAPVGSPFVQSSMEEAI